MALTEIPSELSSTPSIVDNGNATAITIDGSENVGVGVGATTVNRKLEVAGNNNGGAKANYIRITDTDTSATADNQAGGIEFFTNDVTAGIAASIEVLYAGSGGGGELTFNTNASSSGTLTEALRIDESGNLLVGKNALEYENTAGHIFRNDGLQSSIRSGGNVADFNRLSSNGEIIRLSKDGATVGNISVISGDRMLFATADGLGLLLDKDNNRIVPSDAAGGANSNVSLGSSGLEFKDLYLSGGAYLGGTAAVNKLDSYEEGTWTAAIAGMGIVTNRGHYTKIGRLVKVDFSLTVTSASTSAVAAAITGIPFISSTNADSESAGSVMLLNFTADTNTVSINSYVYSKSANIYMYQTQSNSAAWITVKANDLVVGSAIIGSIIYQAQ
jgi:hypothetical protein